MAPSTQDMKVIGTRTVRVFNGALVSLNHVRSHTSPQLRGRRGIGLPTVRRKRPIPRNDNLRSIVKIPTRRLGTPPPDTGRPPARRPGLVSCQVQAVGETPSSRFIPRWN